MTQKKVKASDVIGNSYYVYNLTSTNYTPSLNGTINITCTVTNVYGQAVSGKNITLYQGSTSKGAKTTNSSGTASWNSISMSSAGLQVFRVENSKMEVFVDNKSDVGHTHSQYLTSHQDISGKANTSDLGAVAFSNDYNDLSNKPNIPSSVTVDTALSSSSNNAIANSTVKNALDNKLDKTHTSYKGKNVVTNSSTGAIEFEDKNNHTHSQYLTSHQDLSDYVTTDDSRLSDARTPTSHTHTKSQITDFPSIPSASSTTPSADTQSGSVGTGTTWARADHKHPKSSLYAEASHTHNYSTFSGSYSDLTNKPSYTPTITSSTTGSYKIGSINISGSSVDIYGKDTDTHQSLTNYVQKSNTNGLIKNDGSIDTNSYLTSHQTLKTINNESLVGTGNISITGGGNVTVDSTWVNNSTNPVQSQLIKTALDGKSDTGHTHSQYLTSHQSLNGYLQTSDVKDNLTSTDTDKPLSAYQGKVLKTSIDEKVNDIFDFYNTSNWSTINGNNPTITDNRIQINSVSHIALNKELTQDKYYTLNFTLQCTQPDRQGFLLFGDESYRPMFGIIRDVSNTFVEQYDANGDATLVYTGSKNYFTIGSHTINLVRENDSATLYIDGELFYTFSDIGNCTNILGLRKWGSSNVAIQDITLLTDFSKNIVDIIYPIGAIYMSINSINPSILFGGAWEQIEDKFLLASGSTYSAGSTGGSADATLVSHQHGTSDSGEYFVTSEANGANNTRVQYNSSGTRYVDGMTTDSTPFHHRVGTGYVGSSGTGKNMPPYMAVYVWKRTA